MDIRKCRMIVDDCYEVPVIGVDIDNLDREIKMTGKLFAGTYISKGFADGINAKKDDVSFTNLHKMHQAALALSKAPDSVKNVIFSGPCTIVFWDDGTKTVVRLREGDTYDKRTAILYAMAKKAFGNNTRLNKFLDKWCEE